MFISAPMQPLRLRKMLLFSCIFCMCGVLATVVGCSDLAPATPKPSSELAEPKEPTGPTANRRARDLSSGNRPSNLLAKSSDFDANREADESPLSPDAQRLVDAGWSRTAATAVIDMNRRWLDALVQDMRQSEVDRLMRELCALGHLTSVTSFLDGHPELAGLFLDGQPEQLLALFQSLEEEEMPFAASMIVRARQVGQLSPMLAVLSDHRSKQLAVQLQRFGYVGAEALLLRAIADEDRDYAQWLNEELSNAVSRGDSERISTLIVAHTEFGHDLRELFKQQPELATRIRNEFWPKLYQLSTETDTALELYLLDEDVWNVLAMPTGEALIRRFGGLASQPFFGPNRWPENTHHRIAEVMLVCGNGAAEFVLNSELRQTPAMSELLQKSLTPAQLASAFARVGASPHSSDELKYLASLDSRVLQDELRGDVEGGLVDWIPLVTTIKKGSKFLDGRRVSAWEWAEVGLDVGSTVLMFYPVGATVQTAKGASVGTRGVAASNAASRTIARTAAKATAKSGKAITALPSKVMGTLKTGSAVRNVTSNFSQAISKGATIDVTDCVKSFYRSSGLDNKAFKGLTGLEPQVFMMPSGHVLFHADRFAINNAGRFFKAARVLKSENKVDASLQLVKEEMSAYMLEQVLSIAK